MRSIPQATGSEVKDTGPPGMAERARDPASPKLRSFLSFLRRPAFVSRVPGALTPWRWLGWIGLLLVVAILGGEFDKVLVHAFHWTAPAGGVWGRFLRHPSWAAVTALLVSPALEELGFRAFLSTAPKFVFTGITFFSAYLYVFIQNNVGPITVPTSPAAVLSLFLHGFWVILPAGAISLLLYRYRREQVLAFFRRRAGWVFWTSCVIFGAGHNLLYSNSLVWWGFALVMPQFLAGVVLAYLRVTFGLRWSIASHYALDTLAVLPGWLYLSAVPDSPLYDVFLALSAVLLLLIAYGLVSFWRVVRLRW
jgi:hypothetical protein